MKAWMRVSATESGSDGRSLEMFLRWKKADLTFYTLHFVNNL